MSRYILLLYYRSSRAYMRLVSQVRELVRSISRLLLARRRQPARINPQATVCLACEPIALTVPIRAIAWFSTLIAVVSLDVLPALSKKAGEVKG